MIRLFHVYYPGRTLVLLGGEALIVCSSFLLATVIRFGVDSYLVLNYEYGLYKILAVTGLALLCSHYFDLYESQQLYPRGETWCRLLVVLGILALLLALVSYLLPDFVLGNWISVLGVFILTFTLIGWRAAYAWLIQQPYLVERVYVLGAGERANRLVEMLRTRADLGMEVVGWAGASGNGSLSREALANILAAAAKNRSVDRMIVALADRRGTMPVAELLQARLSGIKVDDAGELLEKISGKIEVDELYPSSLIFCEGFRLGLNALLARRVVSMLFASACSLMLLPLIPLIALAIKLTSPGPVMYRQRRVGLHSKVFVCYKFRTMLSDAEAGIGPTWATGDDPRITPVGRFLRKTRLDEIPQLWSVLRGDMGLVGPRPERPEFVKWLSHEIPYYHLRHIIRPGITGWAQVNYHYSASLEESKEKLRYDLYYIKNMSISLDLLILFQTVKIVLFGRGSR